MTSHLTYIKGDATSPITPHGCRIIAHVVNTEGKWGKGFVLAISKKWEAPERLYKQWYSTGVWEKEEFKLGNIQFVDLQTKKKIRDCFLVANMVSQNGIKSSDGKPLACLNSLKTCLSKLSEKSLAIHATIHMPRICTGLGGRDWSEVEPIIREELVQKGTTVYVYNL